MSLYVDVAINRELVVRVEIRNVTANGPDPELPVHTYDWTFVGEGERTLDGRIEHVYKQGAMVLAANVLEQIAQRYRVAAAVLATEVGDDPADIFTLAGIAADTHCLAESPLGFVCSQAPDHDGWHHAVLLDGRRLDAWPPE